MFDAKVFGTRVLLSRRDLDWDQAKLAETSGVSRSRISEIERGRGSNVGIDSVFGLSDALGVGPAYLMGLTDDPLGEGSAPVLKQMSGEYIAVDVEDREQRQLIQEAIDTLTALHPRDRRIAMDLLRSMRKVEERDNGPLVPRIIE